MNRKLIRAGAAIAAAASLAGTALAGADDYAFEPVQAEVRKGDDALVSVRLRHKATGRPVTDAVIIRTRIDMAPDGMAEMASPLTAVPSDEPGGTKGRYRDNRVKYFFEHPAELVAAGGLGVAFGVGAPNQTDITTDGGQFARAVTSYYASPFAIDQP